MEREWKIEVTGPHVIDPVVATNLTWTEATAEAERLKSNRHARTVEIKRS